MYFRFILNDQIPAFAGTGVLSDLVGNWIRFNQAH